MGIGGLTTYLRENKRALSQTVELQGHKGTPTRALVVDAWSFIYMVWHNSGLPWVYGGEYEAFSARVIEVVEGWLRVGLKPSFVFDGPTPSAKFSVALDRLNKSFVQPSLLFFRTSSAARGTPRFLAESRIRPPFLYQACVDALRGLAPRVECYFADLEGDPFAVELAGRTGACVAGMDSDFIALTKEGYRGYIPLDEMVWLESAPVEEASQVDSEFQEVGKPKARKAIGGFGRGLIPPSETATLSVTIYHPDKLAANLGIPTSLIPLLGALLGNDYSSFPTLFFERKISPPQRVVVTAKIIANIIKPSNRKSKEPFGVLDLINGTVSKLLLRPTPADEQARIVEAIVQSTLQYAIPKTSGPIWPTPDCPLHDPATCLLPALPSALALEDPQQDAVRAAYLKAYREGYLSPDIMDVVATGSMWPTLFLEDPDLLSPTRTIGRKLRLWIYAILDDGIALPVAEVAPEQAEAETQEHSTDQSVNEDGGNGAADDDEEDDDEVIDVVEEDSEDEVAVVDPLAALQGALRRLGSSNNQVGAPEAVVPGPGSLRSVVTEYLRRGTTAVLEIVRVPLLSEALEAESISFPKSPVQIQHLDDRFTLLLAILHSDFPMVRDLDSEYMLLILALRWVLVTTAELGGTMRWTRKEAMALITSCLSTDEDIPDSPSPIVPRAIQLTSHICAALEAVEHLAMVLLLAERFPSASALFSGRRFHSCLSTTQSDAEAREEIWTKCWEGASTGLDHGFVAEKAKRTRKGHIPKNRSSEAVQVQPLKPGGTGMFSVLEGFGG